jgi:hypothetical protein
MNTGTSWKRVSGCMKRVSHAFVFLEMRFRPVPHMFPCFHMGTCIVWPCTTCFLQLSFVILLLVLYFVSCYLTKDKKSTYKIYVFFEIIFMERLQLS